MRKFKASLVILVLSFLILYTSLSADAGRGVNIVLKDKAGKEVGLYKESHALIIGVSGYTSGWPKLPGVLTDVKLLKEELEHQGFQVVVVKDPNRSSLLASYDDFINKYGQDADNRLLFYFAGHGHTLKLKYGGDMGYIIPVDAPNPNQDERGFLSKAVSMQQIEVYAKNIQSKHAMFLFDSCFSGSIFNLTRAVPEIINEKTSKPVRQFITSGDAGEQVPDESVFRGQFIAALKGKGDLNGDGYVTGVELGEFLQDKVVNYSKGTQHPKYGKIRDPNLDEGDFVFPLKMASLGSEIPDIKIKDAPKADFSLEDLDKKAKQIEDNRDAWSNTLKKMQGAFNKVSEYQKRDIEKGLKVAAWNKFLDSFPEKNPYSDDDEAMRRKAREEMERWQKVAMAPVVGDTRDPVTGMELIFVKGGCYQMGDTFGDGDSDEKPMHEVCVDDFYIGKYEVTVGEFRKFVNDTGYRTDAENNTGGVSGCFAYDQDDREKQWNWREWASWKNPNKYQRNEDNHPVACISYNDAKAFIEWMGRKSGKSYRLPTEAEWEYAARGGTTGRNYWGSSKEEACRYANVADRTKLPDGSSWNNKHECSDGYAFSSPVGSFQANAFGLYDMMGNVWEWTQDWYDENYYRSSSRNNPQGANSGQSRVLRGGSWKHRPAGRAGI